jgi:hypothetical protein
MLRATRGGPVLAGGDASLGKGGGRCRVEGLGALLQSAMGAKWLHPRPKRLRSS